MTTDSDTRNDEHRRRSRATRDEGIVIVVTCVIAAIAAPWISTAAPTGVAWVDAFYLGAAAALTVVAAARARRWSILVAAALVAAGSQGWALALALLAVAIGFYLAWQDRRTRTLGTLAGGLIAVTAGVMVWPASPTGSTMLLAALAIVPLWISGYRIARRPTRRMIRRAVGVLAGIWVLGILTAGVFALISRSEVTTAVDRSRSSATQIAAGGGSEAESAKLRLSAEGFSRVRDYAGSWWATPAWLVPGVTQQVRAVRDVSTAGAELAGAAADVVGQVEYDRLQLDNGGVDLSTLESFRPDILAAEAAVDEASLAVVDARSPWLVPPLSSALDELSADLDRAGDATSIAAAAARDLPAMLGGDGPRRLVLLLGNPAESRDLGGHIGSWAEITADGGKLEVERTGNAYDLFSPASTLRPSLGDETAISPALLGMDPTRFPQNWGATADLRDAATVVADLYPQVVPGPPVDGVIYADPEALAAMLSLVGPVQVAGVEVDSDSAVEFLTSTQFTDPALEDGVSDLVDTALDRFVSTQLPAPNRLAEVFGPVIDAGRLQFVQTEGATELLELTGLEVPVSAEPDTDTVMVINRNAVPSKIDRYLQRTVDYVVNWDSGTGKIRSRVIVTLTNDPPPEGLPPVVLGNRAGHTPGSNRTQLSVLSSLDPVGAMVEGDDVDFTRRADVGGLKRLSLTVDVPAGASRTVIVDLDGELQPGDYRLRWYSQPLVNDDTSRLVIRTEGAPLAGGATTGFVELGNDRVQNITVPMAPS